MSGHVEALFSAAYDGELSPDARGAFDRHLGECSACATGFAELTTAVDALREQPIARMPHPVRLPEGSPVSERRWFGLPAWLPQGRRLVASLTAVGVVAAAGVAAALVITGGFLPGSSHHSASTGGFMSAAAPAGNAAGPLRSSACTGGACPAAVTAPTSTPAALPLTTGACTPQTLSISAASAAQIPAGFPNHETEGDGFTTVVIATQAYGYTPGATVDIYARLIDDGNRAVYLPCTFLAGPEVGGSSAALGLPATATSATPTGTLTVSGEPVLEVVVPGTATASQTYQIVVDVPAGAGEAQAKDVTLLIQVT